MCFYTEFTKSLSSNNNYDSYSVKYFNKETISNLAYYLLVTNIIIDKSQRIEMSIYQILKNSSAYKNIEEIINIPLEDELNKKGLDVINSIRFENVSMGYGENMIFEGLTFKLSKGDAILINGKNGSGKSSLLKLISGLIKHIDGDIYFNDVDINNINIHDIRENICYLSQEELLLNEELNKYLNIISGNDISEEEYNKYKDMVKLKNFNECIKDNGLNLSGGQKKKILLMKLLAKKIRVH